MKRLLRIVAIGFLCLNRAQILVNKKIMLSSIYYLILSQLIMTKIRFNEGFI